ncbi:winged helix-turn-helix domain-containing protein [Mucilaginibacter myungsuensis]|uniref:Winged helix-turn-helix domain-containing protein n=1 Tax=Mucilaginibacter myungsuensis TaxID=649104 RepID=A0A929PVE3_9SPHI|nr:winged helix-turn-helix domain-containing protein [Mucilaginibacter myungsuensis]
MHRNRLLPRKDLLTQVWGDDDLFSSRSLDVYISRLRRYLNIDHMVQIINNRGFGYKLIC